MNEQTKKLFCGETGKEIDSQKAFCIATRANDSSRYVILSKDAVDAVPAEQRETGTKTFATGGFEIYIGSIGKNKEVNYQVDGDGGKIVFSVSAATALEFFPKTHEAFPSRQIHFRGEESPHPVNMAVPIT